MKKKILKLSVAILMSVALFQPQKANAFGYWDCVKECAWFLACEFDPIPDRGAACFVGCMGWCHEQFPVN